MPAIKNGIVVLVSENTCVFCGEELTEGNIVSWDDMDLGGISHEVCPETLLDNVDDYPESSGDSQW